METAERILVVGGVSILTFGFLLGLPLSTIRMREPHAPRHLVTAHLAAIIQGALLLALTKAVTVSTLSARLETLAAALLLAGVSLFTLGATVNWLQRIDDHFAVRSLGWWLLAVSGPLNIAAAAILLVGVVKGS